VIPRSSLHFVSQKAISLESVAEEVEIARKGFEMGLTKADSVHNSAAEIRRFIGGTAKPINATPYRPWSHTDTMHGWVVERFSCAVFRQSVGLFCTL